jgi:hypothetical protein
MRMELNMMKIRRKMTLAHQRHEEQQEEEEKVKAQNWETEEEVYISQ